jgi:hypothetical protein
MDNSANEIQNQINQLEAAIEQMENHELFSDREKRDRIKEYKDQLEQLYLKKAENIEVNEEKQL